MQWAGASQMQPALPVVINNEFVLFYVTYKIVFAKAKDKLMHGWKRIM